MAGLWARRQTNDENQFSARSKQTQFPRTHSVKKQVFGELKNVIHNQHNAITPFKGPIGYTTAASHKKDNHGQKVPMKCKAGNESVTRSAVDMADRLDELDYFDFPKVCCTETCHKSVEQIWNEARRFNDTIWEDVIQQAFSGRINERDDDNDDISSYDELFAIANDHDEDDDIFLKSIPSIIKYEANVYEDEEDNEITGSFEMPILDDF